MKTPLAAAAAIAGAAAVAWGERHTRRVSHADYPARPQRGPEDGRDVVLVLGYPPRRDGSPGFMQRWRVRIAIRSAPPGALFLFSGAAVHGDRPEADIMADYAETLGIRPADIDREREATTTRENVAYALPWLRRARTIRIASYTGHARRARRYLRETDAAVFARLRRTRDFVPLELGPFRLGLIAFDALAVRGAARCDAA